MERGAFAQHAIDESEFTDEDSYTRETWTRA